MTAHDIQRWDPAALGPLDREFTPVTGSIRCFAGEERFLSQRKLAARERLWATIQPRLEKVLDEGETVLHVAPVLHNPRFLEVFGFGVWYALFFRAALVLTDRRVVEIMLRKPSAADTCVRSYTWGQVKQLKLQFGTLSLKPARGRTQRWKLKEGGDRKLLKLLLPRVNEQLVPRDIQTLRPVPLWHCPQCGASSPKSPKSCASCGTRFKTQGLAAGLSLAFPGAGLLYAGHPVLATLDFLGEAMIFFFVAAMFLLAGGPAEIVGAVTFGAIMLFFTKLESAHVASVLVNRTRPESRPAGWRRAAVGGAVLTLVLMAVPPVLSGAFANRLDRDLDLSANTLGWSGSRDPASWQFGVDEGQRSEWIRDDGQGLFVFGQPLAMEETFDTVAGAFRIEYGDAAVEPVAIGGFEALRVVEPRLDEEGGEYLWVRWVLFDREFDDLHILGVPVFDGDIEALEADIDQLLQVSSWVTAGG